MAETRVPSYIAEGRRAPFPKGTFVMTLDGVRPYQSETSTDLNFQLNWKNPVTVEGPEVGNRTYSFRADVILGGRALVEIQQFDASVPFRLQRAATTVTQLALAFGAANIEPDHSVRFDMEAFLLALEGGVYNGRTALIEVGNRPWTSKKTGNTGTDDSPLRIAASEAQGGGNGAVIENAVPESSPEAAGILQSVATSAARVRTL